MQEEAKLFAKTGSVMGHEMRLAAVTDLFAKLHSIDRDRRETFRARLRHFQRLGFPGSTNTGTGRRASYSASDTLMLGLVLEVTQLGLGPERAIELLTDHKGIIRDAVKRALDLATKFTSDSIILMMKPTVLTRSDPEVEWLQSDKLGKSVNDRFFYNWNETRVALLNITALIREIALLVKRQQESANDWQTCQFVEELRLQFAHASGSQNVDP